MTAVAVKQIAVVAPAGVVNAAEFSKSVKLIEEWGHTVIPGAHVFDSHLHCAGTVESRVQDLVWALTAPDIDVVWIARGGYGLIHCMPFLPPRVPTGRIVIGSSDATALLAALWGTQSEIALLHGPMVQHVAGIDEITQHQLRDILQGHDGGVLEGHHFCGPKRSAQGVLIGGNLSVVASLAGTPWALPRFDSSILVLEDLGERPYRLDRAIEQLRWSGGFQNVAAILLGDFLRCDPASGAQFSLEDVLSDRLSSLNVPVIAGIAVGHGKRNDPWGFGATCELVDGVARWHASR